MLLVIFFLDFSNIEKFSDLILKNFN